MTSFEFADLLSALVQHVQETGQPAIDQTIDMDEADVSISDVRSYQDAAILTSDAGFVVRLSDGNEYQITVVQSR